MDRLVEEACSRFATLGPLASRNGDFNTFRIFPFTLLPICLRRSEFDHALRLGAVLNKLTMAMASDHDFLRHSLRDTAAADKDFTGRLVALLDQSPSSPHRIDFSINRYDFFINASADPNASSNSRGLRLVELNCIAAGGLSACRLLSKLHYDIHTHPASRAAGLDMDLSSLVQTDSDGGAADSIAHAHRCFEDKYAVSNTHVIMIVIPPYQLRCEHTMVRWRAWEDHGIDIIRMTLADIVKYGTVSEDGHLQVIGFAGIDSFIVSVAYFRTGYMPEDYPTEKEWKGRRLLERSTAACCPSVAMHLVGLKKIQQVIGEDGVLEKFLNEDEAELVRTTLVQQWDASNEEAVSRALEDPDEYVLKPQREGGGNNLYREDMKEMLYSLSCEQRGAYTLMQRIHAGVMPNVLVRDGMWKAMDMHSEMEIFTSLVAVDGKVVRNESIGCSVKSKQVDVDEGGVDSGAGALSSLLLQ